MATVRDIKLEVGRTEGTEFAQVEYDVDFSDAERQLGLRFREVIDLMEKDGTRDYFAWSAQTNPFEQASGQTLQFTPGGRDEWPGRIHDGTDLVATDSTVHRSWREDWDFGDQESGSEEYIAMVRVIPEISMGGGWSEQVSANLG